MARYEVRPGEWDPRNAKLYRGQKTFSVGIAEKGTRAAIYRVSGSVRHPEQVDRLAERLVAWLNSPERTERCPYEVPYSNDGAARIRLTAAGKQAGWLRP